MKKFIPFFALPLFIVACNSKPADTETKTIQSAQQTALPTDTAGLAAFQQWKAQNELAVAMPAQQQTQPQAEAPVRTVTVIREVRVPHSQPAKTRRQSTVRQQPTEPVQQLPEPVETPAPSPAPGNGGDVASSSGAGTGTAEAPSSQPETAKNEGMSKSTKGAVIGGAGGAVIGAVINKKNRAAGAVIGGILGGAAGYGIGKIKEKKEANQ